LGDFDRHSLRVATSGNRHLNLLSYGLEAPLGIDGLKFQAGASISKSQPKVVATNLDTNSSNAHAGVSYPVLRSRQVNLGLRAQVAGYNNSSDALSFRISEDRIRAVRIGLAADYADAAGGVNLLDLEVSKGLAGLGASKNGDALLNGVNPGFTRTTVYLARLQHLGGAWSLLGAATAQGSGDKLPTAEQLGLGGETFLRGYDPSEAIGERGYAAKLELRFNADIATLSTTLYAYADAGTVKRRRVSDTDLTTSLTSAGVGVRFSGPARVRGFLEVAKPTGDKVASKDSNKARVFAGFGIDF
jgi:hemolysin activation/secretion protein